uniref:Uncharacterized protein n=1 Tax=viral metagenome TaxID=1070528 RepID=A0A6C0JC01_9ZZZZ
MYKLRKFLPVSIVIILFSLLLCIIIYLSFVTCKGVKGVESFQNDRKSRRVKMKPKRKLLMDDNELLRPEEFSIDQAAYINERDLTVTNNLLENSLADNSVDILNPVSKQTAMSDRVIENMEFDISSDDMVRPSLNELDTLNNISKLPSLPRSGEELELIKPEALDPSIVHYQKSLPVVELKNEQALLGDPFRGDIPITIYPDLPIIGKPRFDRDSLRLDGMFSDALKEKYAKLSLVNPEFGLKSY